MATTFVEELADDLVTQGVCVAKGTDVHADFMPARDDATEATVAIYEPPGPTVYDGLLRAQRAIVFRVRASTYQAANDRAWGVYDRWHGITDVQLEDHRVLRAYCSTPGTIGRDGANDSLVIVNAEFMTARHTAADAGTGTPCAYTISAVTADTITRTTYTLSWTTNLSVASTMYWRTNGDSAWDSFTTAASTSHSHQVTGLTQGTQQDVYMTASCANSPSNAPAAWHSVTTGSTSGSGFADFQD